MDETQVLRIRLIGESNLSQVMNKEAADIARLEGQLGKLNKAQTDYARAMEQIGARRTNASEGLVQQSQQLDQAKLVAREEYNKRLAALLAQEEANNRQHFERNSVLQQQEADKERQAKELLTKVHEQQEAETERHNHRMLDLQMQLAKQKSEGNVYGATRTKLDISLEESTNARRTEQLARREQNIQEAALSTSKTLNAQRIQEEQRAAAAETQVREKLVKAKEDLSKAEAEIETKRTEARGKYVAEEQKLAGEEVKVEEAAAKQVSVANQQVLNEQKRINQEKIRTEQQVQRELERSVAENERIEKQKTKDLLAEAKEQERIQNERVRVAETNARAEINTQRELERERQQGLRQSMQNSFAMFGLALGAQSLMRAIEEGGGKVPAILKTMASGLSTVSDLMLTGSVISAKYGASVGFVVGAFLAAESAINSLDDETQGLNKTLESLAKKENDLATASKWLDITKEEAKVLLEAANNSGVYAQKLAELMKLREQTPRDQFMGWLKNTFGAWATTELTFKDGGPKFQMDDLGNRKKAADESQAALEREAAQINRLQTIYDSTLTVATKYYEAVKKGAQDATRENQQFAKTLQDVAASMGQARQRRNESFAQAADRYGEAVVQAEKTKNDRLAELDTQRAAQERAWANQRETIARELGQRLVEIEYQTQQRILEIEHQANEQRRTTMRDYYDAAADAAFQYTQQVSQLEFDAMRNEQEYQFDLKRLNEQAAIDRAQSEQDYATQRAKIARDFAYERYKIERELNQSLIALGFNTGEQMMGAKTEHEMEAIQRRYQFEAYQLRTNARNQMEDLSHKTAEDQRALDERQAAERQAQQERLRMAREELEHWIAMQREETAHRREQLAMQYQHEREVADRELAQKLDDIARQEVYEKQQAEEKAQHDRELAQQQAADQTKQLNFQIEQQKKAMEAERAQALKRYEDEKKAALDTFGSEMKAAQDKYDAEAKAIGAIYKAETELHNQRMAEIEAETAAYKAMLDEILGTNMYQGASPNSNVKEERLEVPGHAQGVENMVVNRPYLFVAGERQPEVVNVKPVGHVGASGGSDRPIQINIYDATDPDRVWMKIQPRLREELRR